MTDCSSTVNSVVLLQRNPGHKQQQLVELRPAVTLKTLMLGRSVRSCDAGGASSRPVATQTSGEDPKK